MSLDIKTTNKEIYTLLGWGRTKFDALCKTEPGFSGILKEKREESRIKTFRIAQGSLVKASKVGNVVASIFLLKALGVSDGSHPVQEPEKEPEKDPNHLAPEDFTLTELKQIKKCKDAAKKRKLKKVKK